MQLKSNDKANVEIPAEMIDRMCEASDAILLKANLTRRVSRFWLLGSTAEYFGVFPCIVHPSQIREIN